jgi:hypothetical protein
MELNKTRCKACGYVHEWQGYKFCDTPAKEEWNAERRCTCQQCGSTNVENVEDDETMAPARAMASLLFGPRVAEATKDVKVMAHSAPGHPFDDDKPSSGRKEKAMKVYVSGTSKRADLANEVMQRLQDEGHIITMDWTIDIPSEDTMDADQLAARAEKAVSAVCEAGAVVLLITKEMRGVGSMIEVGAALGKGIPVLVAELEEGFDHFFSFHPLVWRAHSVAGIMKQLVAIEG